jgi:hypothetical protein
MTENIALSDASRTWHEHHARKYDHTTSSRQSRGTSTVSTWFYIGLTQNLIYPCHRHPQLKDEVAAVWAKKMAGMEEDKVAGAEDMTMEAVAVVVAVAR